MYPTLVPATLLALATHAFFKSFEPASLRLSIAVLAFLPALLVLASAVPPLTLTSFAATYGTYYTALALSIAVYRLSPVHPLSNYPGPVPCKLSKLCLAWVASTGKLHLYIRDLHDQYGPIVRIGPNELSIIDTTLLPGILGTDSMPKGPMWDGRQAAGNKGTTPSVKGGLIGARDKQRHAELRRVWNRAFTTSAVKQYEPIVLRRASQLVRELKKRCEAATMHDGRAQVDMAQWLGFFSFDFMGDFVFSETFGLLDAGEDKDGLIGGTESSLYMPSVVQQVPWTVNAARLLRLQVNKLGELALRLVTKRLKEGSMHYDLFYHINDEAKLEQERTPLPVVVTNTSTAIVAGSDTTATALSNIIYFLLLHPVCFSRLRDEIDEAFSPGTKEPTDTTVLAQMPYLNAVINEGLRLYPPVPTMLQRAPSEGSGGHLLGPGLFIPEGTAVTVPPYAMHRSPRYFSPDPDKFMPERWLADSATNVDMVTDRSAFIPFSMGSAGCVGKPLALVEMRVVLALLVQTF
ncbi:hypothetical protein EVJ58_g10318 [Rhodofomes roseus]|uniref:Cytochrome P450 n=1 Tax=Rhodofomes roseus TaxID=34475 RepID=A0A4Y9XRT9_9APHY|nr:hypothetical protein EVJ58_g10318 [Rhodofomes roseus]